MNDKLNKTSDFFYKFCRICLIIIASIASIAILIANFLFTTTVFYGKSEKVTVSNVWTQSVALILVLIIAIILAAILNKIIDKINVKKLFVVFSIAYILAGLYIILNADKGIRADAYHVFDSAKNYMAGNFKDFELGGYMSRYPQQIGLMCLDYLLLKFSSNTQTNFILNLVLVLGINYFNYLIANELFENKKVNIFTIAISFAFLPQLFYIMFAYGLIPGFFMMIIAFYFTIKFGKKPSFKYAIVIVIASAFACFLKSNYLIGCLSIAIYMVICMFKEKKLNYLVLGLAVLVCMSMPTTIATNYFEGKTDADLHNGAPTVLWLAMGTDMENIKRAPGWYNRYNWDTYNECQYDSQKAGEMGKEKLKHNLSQLNSDKKEAIKFFAEKNITQWTDPLYQSIWSGPLKDCGQNVHTGLLKSIYNGQAREHQVGLICKFVTLTIWIFAIAYLIKNGKKQNGWELFFTYFIGGLLFHTIWEAKSQYVYTYVFSLIPLCSYALAQLVNKLATIKRRDKNEE